jgi:signal transduction histidine kinase
MTQARTRTGRRGAERSAGREQRQPARSSEALRAELAAVRAELEACERSRAELCSVLSHDLRNPLTVIVWSTQTLARNLPPDHAGRRPLDAITRASDELSQMLDDLSEAARIREGRLRLANVPCDVAALVGEVVAAGRPAAQAKDLAIEVDVSPGLASIYCDRPRVARVLARLLANAVRITPRGGALAVRAAPSDDFGDESTREAGVCLSVQDGGPGVPEDERASYFDLPRAPPPGEPRRARGQSPALALFVARGVVEAHGGRMWIEGEPGRSRCVLTLPAGSESEGEEAAAE